MSNRRANFFLRPESRRCAAICSGVPLDSRTPEHLTGGSLDRHKKGSSVEVIFTGSNAYTSSGTLLILMFPPQKSMFFCAICRTFYDFFVWNGEICVFCTEIFPVFYSFFAVVLQRRRRRSREQYILCVLFMGGPCRPRRFFCTACILFPMFTDNSSTKPKSRTNGRGGPHSGHTFSPAGKPPVCGGDWDGFRIRRQRV